MPHVNVTVIGNAPTQEQKSALFSKISNLLVNVLGPRKDRRRVAASMIAISTILTLAGDQ
jgi:phenylpyruvate tautomerase PptA (4-oxalocrotonate tautomerase family)